MLHPGHLREFGEWLVKIYKRRLRIYFPKLDNEEEVVELLRSGEWKIYSSPEGCAPGKSQLLLRRARGIGVGGHAIKLGVYKDEDAKELKERLRAKAKTSNAN